MLNEPKKLKSGFNANPLEQNIVDRTAKNEKPARDVSKFDPPDFEFLKDFSLVQTDQLNVRVPHRLKDRLDDLAKATQRRRIDGAKKILKEKWVIAALELLFALPINFEEVKDLDELAIFLEEVLRLAHKELS